MMRSPAIVGAFAMLLAGVVPRAGLADNVEPAMQVAALLETFHETYSFPGATVAFALPDGTIGDAAVGFADTEAMSAMTPENRMLAASVGKTFVGALVLSLENEQVLRRTDLVSLYLGDADWFADLPNASEITIAHLLTHSAGLPDHVHMDGVARNMLAVGAMGDFRPETAIAYILETPPLFKAGEAWAYTDTGYLLLGIVIEAATGEKYFDLVSERFLVPLGLEDTAPSIAPTLANLAVGYTVDDNPFGLPARTNDETGVLLWNPAIEWTGGGFVSTAHDLAAWGHALFTGAAMDEPYLDRLLDAVPVHPDAPGILYGSGVGIYADTPYGPVYGHGGWVPGYVTSLRHYADHGITIAFQINTDVGIVDDSTDLVPTLEAALAELLISTLADE